MKGAVVSFCVGFQGVMQELGIRELYGYVELFLEKVQGRWLSRSPQWGCVCWPLLAGWVFLSPVLTECGGAFV